MRMRADAIEGDVRIISIYDPGTLRWTTTIVGGPIDGWSMIYRDEEDPAAKHISAIKIAKDAASHASDSQP